mgnify:CR=1 FL=1
MRECLLILCLLLFLPPVAVVRAGPPDIIRFSPLPLLSEHEVREQFFNFCASLEKITHRHVEFSYRTDYEDILTALHRDELDIAYLGPLPYVKIRELDNDIVPLVRFLDRRGESSYTCALAAFAAAPPDLTMPGLNVALTQPYSTCGYLMTEALLVDAGNSLEQMTYSYAGNHELAALAVIRGEALLAGVKTQVARNYSNLGLTVLRESEPLPGFLLVANRRTLGDEWIEQLRRQLLELGSAADKKGDITMQTWGGLIRNGMIAAFDEDYDAVRALLGQYRVPEFAP